MPGQSGPHRQHRAAFLKLVPMHSPPLPAKVRGPSALLLCPATQRPRALLLTVRAVIKGAEPRSVRLNKWTSNLEQRTWNHPRNPAPNATQKPPFPTSPSTLWGLLQGFHLVEARERRPPTPPFDTPLFQESPIVVGAVNFVGPNFIWGCPHRTAASSQSPHNGTKLRGTRTVNLGPGGPLRG